MAQVTIYLDDATAALVKVAVRNAHTSQSRWIADAIKQRVRTEWPASVRALAGAWPDFPTAEEIRKRQAADIPREKL